MRLAFDLGRELFLTVGKFVAFVAFLAICCFGLYRYPVVVPIVAAFGAAMYVEARTLALAAAGAATFLVALFAVAYGGPIAIACLVAGLVALQTVRVLSKSGVLARRAPIEPVPALPAVQEVPHEFGDVPSPDQRPDGFDGFSGAD
jgi:hypothetical protein